MGDRILSFPMTRRPRSDRAPIAGPARILPIPGGRNGEIDRLAGNLAAMDEGEARMTLGIVLRNIRARLRKAGVADVDAEREVSRYRGAVLAAAWRYSATGAVR